MKKVLVISAFCLGLITMSGCSLTGNSAKSTPKSQTGSLWKSIDGGQTWEVKNNPNTIPFNSLDVLSLIISPQNANIVYVGTLANGILKTEDGGNSWKAINFQSEKVYGLAMDPNDSNIIYASGVWQKRGKIFKSLDGGSNWKEIYTTPSEGPLIVYLTIDNKNPKILYASTSDNQVFKTSDAGNSWKKIYAADEPVTKIVIDRDQSNLIYFATLEGDVFKSSDGGKTIKDITDNFSSFWSSGKATTIETDPNHGGWVYVAGSLGILRSKDGGKKWETVMALEDPQAFPVKTLAVKPGDSNVIEYGLALAAYRSIDGGNNWSTYQFDYAKSVQIIRFAPNDGQILYLGFKK